MNLPKFQKIPCMACNQTGYEISISAIPSNYQILCRRCNGQGWTMGELLCQWSNFMDRIDEPSLLSQNCSNVATHTTCDSKGNVVCESHRCRCSKPLTLEK